MSPLLSSTPETGPSWAARAPGPHLPMAVYTSTQTWNPQRLGALAMYCSDGRWGEAFDDFCHAGLHLPRYDRWAVPGGPAWLALRDAGTDFYTSTRVQLDFLVRVHELERIVLIAHYGCAYYQELLPGGAERCVPAQLADLRTAAGVLRDWFPAKQVRAFFAMRAAHALSFHGVEV